MYLRAQGGSPATFPLGEVGLDFACAGWLFWLARPLRASIHGGNPFGGLDREGEVEIIDSRGGDKLWPLLEDRRGNDGEDGADLDLFAGMGTRVTFGHPTVLLKRSLP